jgi:hypothetical protein
MKIFVYDTDCKEMLNQNSKFEGSEIFLMEIKDVLHLYPGNVQLTKIFNELEVKRLDGLTRLKKELEEDQNEI